MAIGGRNSFHSCLVMTAFCGILLQGCATTSSSGKAVRTTAMDKAISGCIASVAIGAISGAIIGGAFGGNRSVGSGAAIGAVVGIGRCAILVELAAAEDREQVRQAELAALQSDRSQTRSFTTKKGRTATVRTAVTAAPLPAAKIVEPASAPSSNQTAIADSDGTPNVTEAPAVAAFAEDMNTNYSACRFTELLIDMDGETANAGKQKWCKGSQGDWEPVAS